MNIAFYIFRIIFPIISNLLFRLNGLKVERSHDYVFKPSSEFVTVNLWSKPCKKLKGRLHH